MSFLKKSLFLVLFLGIVSLSICEEEKRQEEEEKEDEEYEEGYEASEEKRGVFKDALKQFGAALLDKAANALKPK
nr:picturin-2 precursor [Boana picturata]